MAATRRKPRPEASREPAPVDLAKLERDLATLARRKAATKAADDRAAEERDRVIRDAIAADMPRARIAELADLSVQRIDQIRRDARL